jgi:hypothetical protein
VQLKKEGVVLTDWSKPRELSPVEQAFPAGAMDFMPAMDEIPDEFKHMSPNSWVQFQTDWFFKGLSVGVEFYPREGVDAETAVAQLSAIQRSFAPKHEHKEAAVAYLASLWFYKIVDGDTTYA